MALPCSNVGTGPNSEAFLKVATIKKTPVLKREELYQGLIEPGWGAGLLNPAQEGKLP